MKNAAGKRYAYGMVLGSLLGVGSLGWAKPGLSRTKSGREADASLRVTVRMRDYAGVRRGTLDRAEDQLAGIFQKARIKVTWVDCPRTAAELDQYPACLQPADAPHFDMNIVPQFMTTAYSLPKTALGFTSFSMEGPRAVMATVFYDRVKILANDGMGSSAEILAHAMAHELGHLLLRTTGHCSTGIMRAQWTAEDLRSADRGYLLFTSQQAELMRNEVRERAKMQATTEVATATASK